MNKTAISYLDYTWNPLAMRCTPVSPACTNCWHLRMANRLAKNPMISPKARGAYGGETWPLLLQDRLDEPRRCKKPSIIGVQFMGDLWHEAVFHRDILAVFRAALQAPQHTYVFLTKRSERMLEITKRYCEYKKWSCLPSNWWGLVTVENQEWADKRILDLLEAPWAVRGLSCEPLLGAVDLRQWIGDCACVDCQKRFYTDLDELLLPLNDNAKCPECEGEIVTLDYVDESLDWVIAGGETGPGARPMHPSWTRRLRNQCNAAGVPFFFKSWGEWIDYHNAQSKNRLEIDYGKYRDNFVDGKLMYRIGNKRAGRLLDGRKWHEMPEEKR